MYQFSLKGYSWILAGAIIGFICGITIVILGWDNYGMLSIASGFFTSLFVFLTIVFNTSQYFLGSMKTLLVLAMYIITGSLSWSLLGFLLSKKETKYRILLGIYIILWLLAGFFATFIVAVAYA